MNKRDTDDVTNASDRKQPLKTAASMPILRQRNAADNDEKWRVRRQRVNADATSALPDSGDDDDLPRPSLTKSTSCHYVQQTGEQPTSVKPSRADDDLQ